MRFLLFKTLIFFVSYIMKRKKPQTHEEFAAFGDKGLYYLRPMASSSFFC